VILFRSEIRLVTLYELHVGLRQWKLSGSTSPLRRILFTTQNPIPLIIHPTSPATERICVLCSKDVGSWRTAAAHHIGARVVSRIHSQQSLYPHHILRVQVLTLPGHRASAVFCQWLLSTLLTTTSGWLTIPTRPWHQHTFSSYHCLSGHLTWSTLRTSCIYLPNLTSHRFLLNGLPVPLQHAPLYQRQHTWSMHEGGNIWSRLSMNSG
jgi:hypothetical protein